VEPLEFSQLLASIVHPWRTRSLNEQGAARRWPMICRPATCSATTLSSLRVGWRRGWASEMGRRCSDHRWSTRTTTVINTSPKVVTILPRLRDTASIGDVQQVVQEELRRVAVGIAIAKLPRTKCECVGDQLAQGDRLALNSQHPQHRLLERRAPLDLLSTPLAAGSGCAMAASAKRLVTRKRNQPRRFLRRSHNPCETRAAPERQLR
jgi:hypothetical protein